MNSSDKQVQKLMGLFIKYRPYINYRNEVILIPRFNVFFRLDDVNNELELKCKIFEWLSRDAFKTEYFHQERRNKEIQDDILIVINTFLQTNFTRDDMEAIYIYLGNNINRPLAIRFIESGYDMKLLEVQND